jgi:nitroreductase
MSSYHANPRVPDADVDAVFLDRWSPRAFRPDPLPAETLATLLEAARWAPSCFNEQPWRFVYAVEPADRARFAALLSPKNRLWADRAPLLLFVVARRAFTESGNENRWAAFDAGAAWMSLALQARRLGLHAHAMAGFSRERAYAELEIPEDLFEILVAVAIGRRDDPTHLPEDLTARETPGGRRPVRDLAHPGRLPPKAP